MIGEDLDFQVPRARQIFFQEDGRITERGARFTLSFLQERIELRGVMNDAHAAAASAHRRFHDDGVADFPRDRLCLRSGLDRIFGSGKDGNSGGSGEPARRGLVTQQFEKIRRRTNEDDASLFASARESGIFRKKTVTWVDGVDAFFFRQRDDSGDVQIGFDGAFAGSDLIRFVCLEAMQGEPIFLRIDGHGAQAKLVSGAEDAYGDLAAIGGEQFVERLGFLHLSA